jgi:molybdate transport system substrate-binding protein
VNEPRVGSRRLRRLALVAVLAAILAACSSGAGAVPRASTPAVQGPSGTGSGTTGELQIYAAASLKAALDKAADAWHAANPGSTLTISTDSSSALETKIEQGAPADVFLSADTTNPTKLVDGGLASGQVVPIAGNRLVIIVPKGDPAGIRSPRDLAKPGIKVIAAGEKVPITKYATQMVANLAKEPGYPTGFAAGYAANVASQEDSVSGIVSKVELGEGDAGIVYVTDAKGSDKVDTVDVPDIANVPAVYGGVVIEASKNQEGAKAFLDWLAGPGGQAILASFGFLPPTT